MSHHNNYETHILRLANQPSDLLTSSSNGRFTAKIPGNLRDRPCFIHVISGTIAVDGLFEAAEDKNIVMLRHNIQTMSYDITNKGSDQFFGTAILPTNNEKIIKLNEDSEKDLGLCNLPPDITVETVGFTATGEYVLLDKVSHYTEVLLRLEFEKL